MLGSIEMVFGCARESISPLPLKELTLAVIASQTEKKSLISNF